MSTKHGENASDNLLKALSSITYTPLPRQESNRPYLRRQASPKIHNDQTLDSFLKEISSINICNASSLLNSFQSIQAGSNGGPSSSGSSAKAPPVRITLDSLTKTLIDIIKPDLPPPRKAFDCLICFTKFYEDEGALACSPHGNAANENAEKHLICVACIRGYAHNSIFDGPVAHGGIGLRCVTGECENVLLLSDFEHYLSEEDYGPLKTRMQEQCLLDAGLADLITCPICAYKVIVEQSLTFYTCNCGRIQCRNCPRPFDEQHQNRTCQQMAEMETQQASMRRLEPQMSEVMIRKCQKCSVAFIKEEGCNKMTCPRCRTTSCYICRQSDISYDHFCNCRGNTSAKYHGACRTCGKRCRNYEDVADLDRQAINLLRNRKRVNA